MNNYLEVNNLSKAFDGGEIKILGLDNMADEQKAKAELGVVFDTNWNASKFSEMLKKFHIKLLIHGTSSVLPLADCSSLHCIRHFKSPDITSMVL